MRLIYKGQSNSWAFYKSTFCFADYANSGYRLDFTGEQSQGKTSFVFTPIVLADNFIATFTEGTDITLADAQTQYRIDLVQFNIDDPTEETILITEVGKTVNGL